MLPILLHKLFCGSWDKAGFVACVKTKAQFFDWFHLLIPNIFLTAGRATYSDKLFKFRNGRFEDLLGDVINVRRGVASDMAGRSVACVDRKVSKPTLHSIHP